MAKCARLFSVLCLLFMGCPFQASANVSHDRRICTGIPVLSSPVDASRADEGSDRTPDFLEVARRPSDCAPLPTTSGAAHDPDEESVVGDETLLLPIPCGYPSSHFNATTPITTGQGLTATAAPTENILNASSQGSVSKPDDVGGVETFFVAAALSALSPVGERGVTAPGTLDKNVLVPSSTSFASQMPGAFCSVAAGGAQDWSATQQVQNQQLLRSAVLVVAMVVFVWISSVQDDRLGAGSVDLDAIYQKMRASLFLYSWSNASLRNGLGRARQEAACAKNATAAALIERDRAREYLPRAVASAVEKAEQRCLADAHRRNMNNNDPPSHVAWLTNQVRDLRNERDGHAAVAGRLRWDLKVRAEELAAARAGVTRTATDADASATAAAAWVRELATARAEAARAVRDTEMVREALRAAERERDGVLFQARASARRASAGPGPTAMFAAARAQAKAERETEALRRERDSALATISELRGIIEDRANAANSAQACAMAAARELAAARRERDAAVLSAAAAEKDRDDAIAMRDRVVSDALAESADLRQELMEQRTAAAQEALAAAAAGAAAAVNVPPAAVELPEHITDNVSSARAAEAAAAGFNAFMEEINDSLDRDSFWDSLCTSSIAPDSDIGDVATTANPSRQRIFPVGVSTASVLTKRRRSNARHESDDASLLPVCNKRVKYNNMVREAFGGPNTVDDRNAARVPMLTPPTTRQASPIVAFYRDGGTSSNHGRGGCCLTLADILGRDDAWLEATHDYVQWLFPLRQPSRAVPDAPVLTAMDVDELRAARDEVQPRMLAALSVMLSFYGLEVQQEEGAAISIGKAATYNPQARWLRPGDHNSLRLTRVITSLRLFSLEKHADAMRDCLRSLPELQGNPSQHFWQQA